LKKKFLGHAVTAALMSVKFGVEDPAGQKMKNKHLSKLNTDSFPA